MTHFQTMMKGVAEMASEVRAGLQLCSWGWYQEESCALPWTVPATHKELFTLRFAMFVSTSSLRIQNVFDYNRTYFWKRWFILPLLHTSQDTSPCLRWSGVLLLKRQMPLSSQEGIIQVSVGTAPETMRTLLSDHSSKCLKEGFRHRVCRVLIMCYHPGH